MLAQLTNPVINQSIGNLALLPPTSPMQTFVTNFMTIALGLGGLVLIVMFLFGAYEYITAGGDKEAVQKAQKRMTNALVGTVILFSIYLIIGLVSLVFGINLIQVNFPTIP